MTTLYMGKKLTITCELACLLSVGQASICAPLAPHHAPPSVISYRITDLGALRGDDYTQATGINNAGQVVGFSGVGYYFAPIKSHPFLYNRGTIRDIGLFPGFVQGNATAISNSGIIVGDVRFLGMDRKDVTGTKYSGQQLINPKMSSDTPFVWKHGVLDALPLPKTCIGFVPTSINDRGAIAGFVEVTNSQDHQPAIYRGSRETMIALPKGYDQGEANAINSDGSIALTAEKNYGAESRAYIYRNGHLTDLGLIGAAYTQAMGINDSGQVVGSAGTFKRDRSGNTITHGFVWDQRHRMKDLGTLGGTYCEATAINSSSEIVGDSQLPDTNKQTTKELHSSVPASAKLDRFTPHACLWQHNHIYDLNDLLLPKQTHWILTNATAINTHGVIVGYGRLGNSVHAFMLTPVSR